MESEITDGNETNGLVVEKASVKTGMGSAVRHFMRHSSLMNQIIEGTFVEKSKTKDDMEYTTSESGQKWTQEEHRKRAAEKRTE